MANLDRFLEAQNRMYDIALEEIRRGRKASHWMWFIFPQIKGLGKSSTSVFYEIKSKEEAITYIEHPVLGERLIEITNAVLNVKNKTAFEIFGTPDYLKLKSSMTLFKLISQPNSVFEKVLEVYYSGFQDNLTVMYFEDI